MCLLLPVNSPVPVNISLVSSQYPYQRAMQWRHTWLVCHSNSQIIRLFWFYCWTRLSYCCYLVTHLCNRYNSYAPKSVITVVATKCYSDVKPCVLLLLISDFLNYKYGNIISYRAFNLFTCVLGRHEALDD